MSDTVGLLLMTYGSPESTDDMKEYLTNVRGGREPDEKLVEEFKRRYNVIDGSPLNRITREQAEGAAEALQRRLQDNNYADATVRPYVGMRFFDPYIPSAVHEMADDDVDRAVAMILSPQYSPILMKGYWSALEERLEAADDPPSVARVTHWWENDLYQQAVAERIKEALDTFPPDRRDSVPLLLTAHSIPRRVWDQDPDYVDQLKKTAQAIAGRLDREEWTFAYQSAGHSKEEWLKPDMTDLFPDLAEAGHDHVVIAPFQFLADHLEILYDVDVAAREQAEEMGLHFHRVPSLNTHPTFLEALADVAASRLDVSSSELHSSS